MSAGSSSSDAKISESKIEPFSSETKYSQTKDVKPFRGAAGSNRNIDQPRLQSTMGIRRQGQHPATHTRSQGVVGRDEPVLGAKIVPLVSQANEMTRKAPGLDDEQVDATREASLGGGREDM